mmetsp:Transcript_86996/g.246668  ORF Transcript_86996/g.246668 Transcript_86996/m.246668 type:complete len:344 (-) Transcript_86996:89-1120(-)
MACAAPACAAPCLEQAGPGPVLLGKATAGPAAAKAPDTSPGSTVASEGELPAVQGLRLHAGTCQVPRADKVEYGGEDDLFVSSRGSAVGVADGVGEWGARFGVNPRGFARELMEGAGRAAEALGDGPARERAALALREGHAAARAFGAATALVASLDPASAELGVACLGDSGLRHLRRGAHAAAMQVIGHTEEQQHAPGQPFQLSRMPGPADFPALRKAGKGALVEAVRRCRPKEDRPGDAQLYTFGVQEGDLLIVGSDGLFDNLFDSELCAIIDAAVSGCQGIGDLADPADLAEALAQAAFKRSRDRSGETPISQKAAKAGHQLSGGVEDDITVIIAWIVQA